MPFRVARKPIISLLQQAYPESPALGFSKRNLAGIGRSHGPPASPEILQVVRYGYAERLPDDDIFVQRNPILIKWFLATTFQTRHFQLFRRNLRPNPIQ